MILKILIVEDEPIIGQSLKVFLCDAGYQVTWCQKGSEAYDAFVSQTFHLVILDIMLPDINGLDLLTAFRNESDVPILIMSALSDEDSQLLAYDGMADDYITKPFKIRVLLKKIEVILRRCGLLSETIVIGKLAIRVDEYRAMYNGVALSLTQKEFEIMKLLAEHKGKVLTYDVILARVWGYDHENDYNSVHTHIKNIRAKCPEAYIKTVRGVGYKMED